MSNTVMMNPRSAAATRRGLKWLALGIVVAVSATVALSAWAQPAEQNGQRGQQHGHHGDGGPGMFFGAEHGGRGLDRMLDSVSATDAQRTKIKQIAQQAAADLKVQRDAGRALRDKAQQVFTAPTVDATAAETLRQQMLAQHDATSQRTLQAMLAISNVLTAEQRAKLGELLKQRQQHMREHMQKREGGAKQ
ncbi:MAG TPA: Spy/CpxP family protein refolding chaperone [Albitalea sp.]|jgi:Spy/CpxP family protein refolding chaperone|nr:Spy/CpxP family protein refolding chaperone [Albitalea sp.]